MPAKSCIIMTVNKKAETSTTQKLILEDNESLILGNFILQRIT